jgi:hypothetical protein
VGHQECVTSIDTQTAAAGVLVPDRGGGLLWQTGCRYWSSCVWRTLPLTLRYKYEYQLRGILMSLQFWATRFINKNGEGRDGRSDMEGRFFTDRYSGQLLLQVVVLRPTT